VPHHHFAQKGGFFGQARKYNVAKGCLYIKRLADVQMSITKATVD